MTQTRKLKAVSSVAPEPDCRARTELGPKTLDWLRTNMRPFAVMEAEALRLAEERRANYKANGVTL